MYQNRATLIGFLGKDAEVKTTRNNASFTVLSLATKRSWKDRETGERQSQTTWHRCMVWGKLGEFAATLPKGAHVQIEGELRTCEYTQKTGGKKSVDVKKSITEVRVTSVAMLDRPKKTDGETMPEGTPRKRPPTSDQEELAMMNPSHREQLILAHMPQVERLARRLHRRCPQVELDDLISAGTIRHEI